MSTLCTNGSEHSLSKVPFPQADHVGRRGHKDPPRPRPARLAGPGYEGQGGGGGRERAQDPGGARGHLQEVP